MSANSEMQIRRTATSRSTAPPTSTSRTSTSLPKTVETRKIEPILYNEMAVRLNENSLEQCRTSVSALSGCVAGIIGLTSYKGFVFYGSSMFLLSMLICVYIRHEHRKFFTSLNHVFVNGFFNGLLTYVLFWTFVYGIVHVY
jgi:ER membrane protein complex subunit 6